MIDGIDEQCRGAIAYDTAVSFKEINRQRNRI